MITPRHLERFPCMMPRIGLHYRIPVHKRLLVIGESHYLPKSSVIHLDSNNWYEQDEEKLTSVEKSWVSTEKIITKSLGSGFKDKSHGIYRSIAFELNYHWLRLDDPKLAIEHIAFYNFFLRPAVTGKSISVKPEDITVAQGVLEWIIDIYQPELLAFTSRLAGRHAKSILKSHDIPYVITPHPTCAWWNMVVKSYGNLRGRDLLTNFLACNQWLN